MSIEHKINPKDLLGVKKPSLSVMPLTTLLLAGISIHKLHPATLYLISLGLYEGARKYGRHNYRATPILASVYYDATHRHLAAMRAGESIDPDSGLPHQVKAACSLLVLADAMNYGTWVDDRPPSMPGLSAMTQLACSIEDALAMWWEGEGDIKDIVSSLVRVIDINLNAYVTMDSWMQHVSIAHQAITTRYPDAMAPCTISNSLLRKGEVIQVCNEILKRMPNET